MNKINSILVAHVITADFHETDYVMEATNLNDAFAPYEFVKTMRASILTLGPLVARLGSARVSLPGGCAIGARPVDLHIAALQKMGAEINTAHGYIEATVPGGHLKGAQIVFEKISVTGTENVLMAAALAQGETLIENAAREPEVSDLVELLRKMGAEIEGEGTSRLRVRGKDKLHGADHTVIPDRIEAGTFLVAGAITGGDLLLPRCGPAHLGALPGQQRQTGARRRATPARRLR